VWGRAYPVYFALSHSDIFGGHSFTPAKIYEEMTTVASITLSTAEDIFYNLVWRPAIALGETALETAIPSLALPVVKQLDEAAISAISDYIYSKICLLIDIESIQFLNSDHQSAYDEACLRLKVVETEKGIDSPEYQIALEDEAIAFKKFVSFIGS